jgi:hypothetical protein
MRWLLHTLCGLCALLLAVLGPGAWAAEAQRPLASWATTQEVLPVSKIVLYTSGVGYFQRDGHVTDHAEVPLRFKVDNINDLLKSMVIQDFDGGQVTTATYDARDPLNKTLQSFAVDLTPNPGLGALLQQIRGEPLEVATPSPVRGVLLGVEKKTEPVGERRVVEIEYLNLLTDTGLRAIPLGQVQRLTLLNDRLAAELRQALEALAARHDTQKKTVHLVFDGTGRRHVRVAYVVEMPVWKTTYRLLLSDTAPPFLQGWAIVENPSDEDWQHVQLSLVSGRPLSFVMDLYEPLYIERPVVMPELHAALRPPVYEQALEAATEQRQKASKRETERGEEGPKRPSADTVAEETAKAALSMRGMVAAEAPAPRSTPADLALQEGVSSVAQATELGELFEYAINTPVSLARQTSALLPVVSEEVAGTKLSIYNERVHTKHPLYGFRLRNSTALYLMQGPVTVFDGAGYAGDARIADLPAGQEQLLSYGMDLKMEVEPVAAAEQQELLTVSLRQGTLLATRRAIAEKTYTVKNRDQKPKVVLIEHPWRADWQLSMPGQPAERTRQAYRFTLPVAAGQTAQLQVREEKPLQQSVTLTDAGPDMLAYYVQAAQVSPQVQEALQRVLALRDRLDRTVQQRRRLEQRIQEITQEQARIRDNMGRLAQNSELYNRYVHKLDQQETDLDALRQEIETLKTTEAGQKQELTTYLLGLDLG